MKLYRSILFVPGNRPEWIDKAPKYGPDALILDLEDAVPNDEKPEARSIVRAGIERSHKRGVPIVVRVNGLNTGLTGEDVEAVVTAGLVAIAIPKLEKVEEVLKVDAWVELFEQKAGLPPRTVEIVALPETARGIMDVYHLATACPRVGNIVGGVGARSGDVTKAIGYKWTRAGFETLGVASHMLLAARAAGIEYHWLEDRLRSAIPSWYARNSSEHEKSATVGRYSFIPRQCRLPMKCLPPRRKKLSGTKVSCGQWPRPNKLDGPR